MLIPPLLGVCYLLITVISSLATDRGVNWVHMKNTDPILKNGAESGRNAVEHARNMVTQKEFDVQKAQQVAEELNQLLMEIQLQQQQKEEAEREGKEKERQIEAVSER